MNPTVGCPLRPRSGQAIKRSGGSIPLHGPHNQRAEYDRLLLAIFANPVTLGISPIAERTAMPTRNVNLTDELDSFVLDKIESGRYENASEVVRAALRTLEREERQFEAKLAALRTAIDEGDASGVASGNSFQRIRRALQRSKKQR